MYLFIYVSFEINYLINPAIKLHLLKAVLSSENSVFWLNFNMASSVIVIWKQYANFKMSKNKTYCHFTIIRIQISTLYFDSMKTWTKFEIALLNVNIRKQWYRCIHINTQRHGFLVWTFYLSLITRIMGSSPTWSTTIHIFPHTTPGHDHYSRKK
jgi:hypothetical protein